ncbi:MAG: hypothetical protein M3R64_05415 [Pseudomonadota bacterium]|nr:hypothetical protein [Pseudomonadota bacterium]
MRLHHDLPSRIDPSAFARAAVQAAIAKAARRTGRRRPDAPGEASEPCPVGPDRPFDLSGGAAATLAFDD